MQKEFIKLELVYESDSYDYEIWVRGTLSLQKARKAFGKKTGVLMGFELDPADNNGYKLLIPAYMLLGHEKITTEEPVEPKPLLNPFLASLIPNSEQ